MKIEIGNGGFGRSIILLLVVGFFIPAIWVVIVVIAFVMWIMGLVAGQHVANISTPSNLQLNAPVSQAPAVSSTPREYTEDDAEKIHVAKAEAVRIAKLTSNNREGRKRVFERVFKRECQQRGLKVSKVIWKSSEAVI